MIRRLAHPNEDAESPDRRTHPLHDLPDAPPNDAPPKDPKHYELVIDNDSGTYRPKEDLLPVFHDFLERNFPGLHILTKSSTDKGLDKIKEDQKKAKHKEGEERVYGQASDSGSISSSDEGYLAQRAQGKGKRGKAETGVAMLEAPKETLKGLIPGEKSKEERENAEINEDQTANGHGA